MVTTNLRGREQIVETLLAGLAARHATLLYGPIGAGKSAVLHAVAERLRLQGHPWAYVARTASRTDVKAALPPAADAPALLLDGLVGATAPLRAFLHWLQGRGSGIVIAADVANDRDHQRVRAMRLAYRELELPRLEAKFIRELLAALVTPELVEELVPLAHGLPGRAQLAAALVHEPRYWSNGALMRGVLEVDLDAELGRRAMTTPG